MSVESADIPSLEDIKAACLRVKGAVHKTPILACDTITKLSGVPRLLFKCENMQKIGAFKIRGAYNALSKLRTRAPQVTDVVTHSSGNHAQALALAAKLLGLRAHVVMPKDAPLVKVNAVRDYGAEVIFCEPNVAARESAAQEVVARTGGHFVHPYDDRDVIEGQATLGAEIIEELGDEVDALVVPVGGGGMISGVTLAAKVLRPDIAVIGAEPQMADDAFRSKAGGVCVPNAKPPNTIADGLRTNLGSRTWPVVRDRVDDVLTVSEQEIAKALKLVLERFKLVIEPSAAVGVAVVLSEAFKQKYGGKFKCVCVVLCGGNLELDRLPAILKLADEQ